MKKLLYFTEVSISLTLVTKLIRIMVDFSFFKSRKEALGSFGSTNLVYKEEREVKYMRK